jgi:two-component system chemotaxis response regulator CheB
MQHTAGPFAEKGSHYIKKKVVIVDDSRTIRSWLRVVLEQDPRLQVVGEADSAAAARQVIKQTEPDVITLDIEMPGMNGLAFLEKLMTLRPMPVVMISGVTKSNSEATITALSLGAVDCILKPTSPADQAAHRDITRRVFSAACSKVRAIRGTS